MTTNRFILSIFILAIFLNISTSFVFCSESDQKKIILKELSDNKVPINIEIYTTNYELDWPYKEGFRWGTELKHPKILITNISIIYGKKKVFIPLSAYSDLTNPTEYFVQTSNDSFSLLIFGGHASTSYRAELVSENGFIKRRRVQHREFPEEAWEETIYSFNRGG